MKDTFQKTSQHKTSPVEQRASAGPDGFAITPPAYGIESIDRTSTDAAIQMKTAPSAGGTSIRSTAENRTGLPDTLKTGIEGLSGLALDDVRVHYNSPRPAQLNAFAYTQGAEIHVAPGQERYLPHEAWHVVQQKQGRVKATVQAKGIGLNTERGLEREADVMGAQAKKASSRIRFENDASFNSIGTEPIQRQSNSSSIIQLGTATDLNAAQLNRAYLVTETGLLNTAGGNVYTAINAAPAGPRKKTAAAGLRYYWQTLIDGFDGKKAEMYEAEALAAQGHIPILSTNDFTDPDVRTETAGGHVVATEVKAINSDQTANVNALINGADHQLGKRIADEKKIKIRIESRANLWPDARYNVIARITNDTDLRNWLTQPTVIPSLNDANEIQIEGINVPYGGLGATRNFWAQVKVTGDVKKTGSQVW